MICTMVSLTEKEFGRQYVGNSGVLILWIFEFPTPGASLGANPRSFNQDMGDLRKVFNTSTSTGSAMVQPV